MHSHPRSALALWVVALLATPPVAAGERAPFGLQVVDASTGRGVPLVILETVNHIRFVTDSGGWVAIDDPDLLGRNVFFHVRSHGYSFPADGFGFRGQTVNLQPGGRATLKIERVNLAERLYRVTGAGIYRDSALLGETAPLSQPLLNADVVGCDSVMTAIYRGKVYWFWGDTSRPGHPLAANFHITGATSLLPRDGGLPPETGVEFKYFTRPDGGVRPLAEMPGDGPTWISSLTVLKDAAGRERMFAGYVKIRRQLEAYRWGFVVWNDETRQFEQLARFDQKPPIFLEPNAHPFLRTEEDGVEYVYFANPFPLTRVKADPAAFIDPEQYEGFTCLPAGARPEDKRLDRDAHGRLRYAWKRNTPPLTQAQQESFIQDGLMQPRERLIALQDVDTGRRIMAQSGSVAWSDFRQRWILIAVELGGESSLLGEVWFAEADAPTGPWVYARKIVTHDKYSFYNPRHHPFFDQQGGRLIYFEGTYTHTFSGNEHPTPRYDYNQVMYRLDLAAAPLNLPVAVYRRQAAEGEVPFAMRRPGGSAAFFALERPAPESVPIAWNGEQLEVQRESETTSPLFYAIPADHSSPPEPTTLLYEFIHAETGQRLYATEAEQPGKGWHRTPEAICRVWRSPTDPLSTARPAD